MYGRDRRQLPVRLMEAQESGQVHIRHTISIREHEGLVSFEPWLQSFEPTAGLSIESCVDQMNFPSGVLAVVTDCRFSASRDPR